jgi:hypothetical protein
VSGSHGFDGGARQPRCVRARLGSERRLARGARQRRREARTSSVSRPPRQCACLACGPRRGPATTDREEMSCRQSGAMPVHTEGHRVTTIRGHCRRRGDRSLCRAAEESSFVWMPVQTTLNGIRRAERRSSLTPVAEVPLVTAGQHLLGGRSEGASGVGKADTNASREDPVESPSFGRAPRRRSDWHRLERTSYALVSDEPVVANLDGRPLGRDHVVLASHSRRKGPPTPSSALSGVPLADRRADADRQSEAECGRENGFRRGLPAKRRSDRRSS